MNLPSSQRGYCHQCNLLLLPGEPEAHQDHTNRVVRGLTTQQMHEPSYILDPIENKKTNAQYLYNNKAVDFLLSTIKTMGCDRVLCVGTPRLHEAIMGSKVTDGKDGLKSLLLDIDHRYYQFYSPEHYCRYNMFNHHFFDGADSLKTFQDFLLQNGGQGIVMVTDPPFGGLVEVLAFTVKRIMAAWKAGKSDSCSDAELPVIWTFPYFLEFRIIESLSSFHMSDYKVEYDNHALFQCGKKNKGSPVRLFTNIPPVQFKLPEDDGYRLCKQCQRYVSSENLHCMKCDKCTSKDGRSYIHCDQCNKCVKPGRIHCSSCDHCELPGHVCVSNRAIVGCHVCGDPTHKRRQCPQHMKTAKPSKKRKHHTEVMTKKTEDSDKKLKTEPHAIIVSGQTTRTEHCKHKRKYKHKKMKQKFSRKQSQHKKKGKY
ncbi:rRNA N(6)-adenosine-methyltransferase ZCCHC4-like isoform X2 [Glandiceps talaboti]